MLARLLSVAMAKPRTFGSLVKSRIGSRNRIRTFNLHGLKMKMRGPLVLPLYLEIYDAESYLAPGAPKRILDLGANVGAASIYFAKAYPEATIEAIECDPEIFGLLQDNLKANNITSVTPHHFAAWVESGTMSFAANGLGGGRLATDGAISVKTVDMKEWLAEREPFDLIKIDIEGAERQLFHHIADEVLKADYLILEYHSEPGELQNLDDILALIREKGFRYYIRTEDRHDKPLFGCHSRFDNQLNIYAYK